MAELKLDYYKGKDLYSDGDVENELLAIAESGIRPEEQEETEAAFPVLYHFARARENILNWYPFVEGASCLEIGSGCGAITGLLCRRMERVVSVELSKRRAEINFARHREYENLEILVGNLNDMQFDGPFDYVILNGVFEYARSFTEGSDPYGTFLKKIRDFLKPDGVILVAIENRLGLKYFAGAPEDHTNGYFEGIRGYKESSGVCTFSRGEWKRLMERCGLPYYKFYYPYPDYKFPQEIFTDASLETQRYGRPTWNFTKYRMALFEEVKLAATLAEEGVIAQFANSFLIEMSPRPFRGEHDIRYVKLSTDRADEFSIATILEKRGEGRAEAGQLPPEGGLVALKRPMTEAARGHIQEMLAGADRDYGRWKPLRGTAEGDGIVYPFLAQKSLGQLAAEAVRRRDLAEVKAIVARAAELCTADVRQSGVAELCTAGVRQSGAAELCTAGGGQSAAAGQADRSAEGIQSAVAEAARGENEKTTEVFGRICMAGERTEEERLSFRKVFGPGEPPEDAVCISPANIDLILDNIFETDDGWQVIDCEWIFDFPVPVSFVLWRAVNELYSSQPALEQLCRRSAFMEEFGISGEMNAVFWNWATFFAENYAGANRLLRFSQPEIGISIEEFRQRLYEKEYLVSQLFVDTGDGYSEEQKLVTETKMTDGAFSITFDLGGFQNVRAVRFDPLEGRPCICRIDAGRTTAQLTAENAAAAIPEGDLFLTADPIYRVKLPAGADRLTVAGEIRVLSMGDVLMHADALLEKQRRRFPFGRKS